MAKSAADATITFSEAVKEEIDLIVTIVRPLYIV
jgi:hypothetical protein